MKWNETFLFRKFNLSYLSFYIAGRLYGLCFIGTFTLHTERSHHITNLVPADGNKIRNAVCPGKAVQETKSEVFNWVMYMQVNANFIKSNRLKKLILLQMPKEKESIKNTYE